MNTEEGPRDLDRLADENKAEIERRATHPFEVQPSTGDPDRFIVVAFGVRAIPLIGARGDDRFTVANRALAEINADRLNQAYNGWAARIENLRELISEDDDESCCDEASS